MKALSPLQLHLAPDSGHQRNGFRITRVFSRVKCSCKLTVIFSHGSSLYINRQQERKNMECENWNRNTKFK